MAALVWFTMGIAIWHFTVFLPDRFWSGIVGAFIGSIVGAMIFGALVHAASGQGISDTDLLTAIVPIPGALAGIAAVYWIGVRQEEALLAEKAQKA